MGQAHHKKKILINICVHSITSWFASYMVNPSFMSDQTFLSFIYLVGYISEMCFTSLFHVPGYRYTAKVKSYVILWICSESHAINKLVVVCFIYHYNISFKGVTKFVTEVRAVHFLPETQTNPIVNTNWFLDYYAVPLVWCFLWSLFQIQYGIMNNNTQTTTIFVTWYV